MPTGYTAGVQDGTITTFRDFATKCARAFSVNMLMRDEPSDAPIKRYEPSPYHKEQIEKARAALYDAERMTETEAAAQLATEIAENGKRLQREIASCALHVSRYETMLAKVKEWTPPTTEHSAFKKFVEEQIEQSIRFDCAHSTDYFTYIDRDLRALMPAGYRAKLLNEARDAIARHTAEWAEEIKRTDERNAWNNQLFASLG